MNTRHNPTHNKIQLVLKILVVLILVLNFYTTNGQTVAVNRVSGNGCTGANNVFVLVKGGTCSSYVWSVSTGGTIVSGQGTKNLTVKWNSPTNSAWVEVSYGGCSSAPTSGFKTSQSYVLGNPLTPSVGITSNFTALCQGSGTITLTASPTNGGLTPSYQWYIDGNSVSTGTSNQYIYNTSSLAAGSHTAYVKLTTSVPCPTTTIPAQSPNLPFTVTAKTNFAVGVSGGTACSGSPVSFGSSVNPNPGGLSYQWYLSSGSPISGATQAFLSGNLAEGTVVYCRVSSSSFCTNSPVYSPNSSPVHYNPSVTPTVGISSPIYVYCAGTTVTFNASSIYATSSSTYTWSVTGNSNFATTTGLTSSATLVASTNPNDPFTFGPGDWVSVIVTNVSGACLNSTTGTGSIPNVAFTIKPLPSADILLGGQKKIKSDAYWDISAPPGTGYSYQWKKAPLATPPIPGTPILAPQGIANPYRATTSGSYTVTVTLNGCPKNSSNSLELTVNSLPVANAGPDKTLILPENSVTLMGSGTDANGTPLSYEWTQSSGPPTVLNGSNTANLLLEDLGIGTYEFCMIATDEMESSLPNCATVTVNGPPNNYNRVTETTILVKDILNESSINSLQIQAQQKNVNINYYDGLGRPMQSVGVQGSPLGKDLVQPFIYDAHGRETNKYLPVVINETNGFYKPNSGIIDPDIESPGTAANFYTDSRPFAETIFEPSPANRGIKTYGPGEDWQAASKYIQHQYLSNVHDILANAALPGEKIVAWTITGGVPVRAATLTGYVETGGYYKSGQLRIKSVKDEQGNEIREYTDKAGRLILKKVQVKTVTSLNNNTQWALTYYIYDDFGNLRFVLQPVLCASILASDTYNPPPTSLLSLAFQYKYDQRQRMIEKKVPGVEPVYLVYDKFDRLVMTQDGNLRKTPGGAAKKQWMFIKYDKLNRPVMTGIYTHGTEVDQLTMTGNISTVNLYETYNGNASNHGYTNLVFPTAASNHILTVSYYDTYDFIQLAGSASYGYKNNDIVNQDAVANTNVTGMVTGLKTNVLELTYALSTNYLWHVSYYDQKYRVIQTKSQNHKGGIDRVTNLYDFVKLKETISFHTTTTPASSSSYSTHRKFDYSHTGKITKIHHKFHTEPDFVILQQNIYNEKGELGVKLLHSRNAGSDYEQALNYSYNIRGWLEKINDPSSPQPEDLFNMEMKYHEPTTKGGPPQFNGNISEVIWRSVGLDKQSYGYEYDAMNRLIEAKYYNHKNPLNNGNYTEKIGDPTAINPLRPSYDLNGNILNLIRYGKTNMTAAGSTYNIVDDLFFVYAGLDNMLTSINDTKTDSNFDDGFKDLAESSTEYQYDWNGNLRRDSNKGITTADIEYNVLNLPMKVSKSTTDYVTYVYDASGRKLSQKVFGTNPKVTQYINEYSYEQVNETAAMVLQFVGTEEGRIVPDNSVGAPRPWEYQYFIKDHLGNVRVNFSEKKSMQEWETDFESISNTDFLNYSRAGSLPAYDHTDHPGTTFTRSQVLNAGNNSKVGAAKSLVVNPGDIIDLEVYAKYEDPTPNEEVDLDGLITNLISVFNLGSTSTGLESTQAMNAFQGLFAPTYIGMEEGFENVSAPKAYLNYILFDENFVMVDFGFDQINILANQNPSEPWVDHDYLSLHVKVQQKGYLYAFVSNENPVEVRVYFDDLKIVRNTNVEQVSDYYAFGLKQQSSSFDRGGSIKNSYLYNSKELQDELNLGWLDYGARMYMPEMGRWIGVDPLAEKYHDISPFAYVANNPLSFIDPNGAEIWLSYTYRNENDKTVTSRYRYADGNLYKEDGTEYDGSDGADPIFQLVKDQLNSTKEQFGENEKISEIFSFLESKESGKHTINIVHKGENQARGSRRKSQIEYNPLVFEEPEDYDKAKKREYDPRIGLMHEMKHSYDLARGRDRMAEVDWTREDTGELQKFSQFEARSLYIENILRRKLYGVTREGYVVKLADGTIVRLLPPKRYVER